MNIRYFNYSTCLVHGHYSAFLLLRVAVLLGLRVVTIGADEAAVGGTGTPRDSVYNGRRHGGPADVTVNNIRTAVDRSVSIVGQ